MIYNNDDILIAISTINEYCENNRIDDIARDAIELLVCVATKEVGLFKDDC